MANVSEFEEISPTLDVSRDLDSTVDGNVWRDINQVSYEADADMLRRLMANI